MNNREIAAGTVVLLVLALLAAAGLWATGKEREVQAQGQREAFHVLLRQNDPPIILFEHVATKRCFLMTTTGGLISVERTICESLPGTVWPPIGPPVSPEK